MGIVERLKQHIGPGELDEDDQVALVPRWEVEEAIAKIERLRELLRDMVSHLQEEWLPCFYHVDDYPKSNALIMRVRDALGE